MKRKKQITTDELATMVQHGFEHIEEKFDKRFDAVEVRLDRIENITLQGHKNRLARVEY